MAPKRRLSVLVGAVLLTLVLCGSVLFSQAPPGGGNAVGGPPGGAPGMPPTGFGPPGVAPGGAPSVAAAQAGEDMPDALRITYQEAVKQDPSIAEAGIPQQYHALRLSLIEWRQLGRIFLGRVVEVVPREGRIGHGLRPALQIDITQRQIEMEVMGELHDEAVREAFWFEVGMPKMTANVSAPQATPETCTVRVGVVMHSKPKFADRVLARLKNYSGRGEGREAFYFITDRGGYFKYHRLFLSQEAISYWEQLWGANIVELNVYDSNDRRLTPPSPIRMPAGHSGATICDLVRPRTLYYAASDWRHSGGGGGGGMGASSAMGYGGQGGSSGYGAPMGGSMGGGGGAGAGETTFFPFASRPVTNPHAKSTPPGWLPQAYMTPPPRYSHLPEQKLWKRQDGKVMKIEGAKGWYYHFEFQMPIARVGDMDHCTAELVGLPLGAAGAPGAGGMGMPGYGSQGG